MLVDLVRVKTSDGVRLEGVLSEPPAGVANSHDFDLVVQHHGAGANFYSLSFFDRQRDYLLAQGVPVLRVNNRGHDYMYQAPGGRLGSAYEAMDDSRKDYSAWLDLAVERGYHRVCVWAHSLGAVKAVHHMAVDKDPRVVRLVVSSPPRFSHSLFLAKDASGRFKADYAEAQQAMADGKPTHIMPVSIPAPQVVSARTYLDKFGPHDRWDVVARLPELSLPVLLTLGALEGRGPGHGDWYSFGGLADALAEAAEGQANLTLRVIDGADHGYTGKSAELWAAVDGWLRAS